MRTTYNKIVIVEDNIITVLNDSFIHSDDFKGLTGTKFEIVSKKEYKNNTTLKRVEEYLFDCVLEGDIPDEYKYTSNETALRKKPYLAWAKDIKNLGKEGNLIFDLSYKELWDYMREELNLSTDEAYIFNCVGRGRCFNKNDKFTHNKELEYLLEEFEG